MIVACKYYLDGILEGQTNYENAPNQDWELDCEWAGEKTMDFNCNFVVLTLTDNVTGQIENF
jgi:hypothetical protein